jgi:hypothetical protein
MLYESPKCCWARCCFFEQRRLIAAPIFAGSDIKTAAVANYVTSRFGSKASQITRRMWPS